MRLNKLALALSLAALALPLAALAQEAQPTADPAQTTDKAAEMPAPAKEPTPNFTWNLALTSDYVFRGITQTNFKPAVQGGLNYGFGDSGFYVGTWLSNVDFVDSNGPNIEWDTFVGYSTDVSDQVNLDFSIVHYAYLGENSAYGSIDYTEFFAKTKFNDMLTFTVAYSPNYANLDYNSLYVNLAGTWDVGHDFNVNAAVGHSKFSDNNGSYTDWNLGVSRQFGPVNAGLNYYDTSLSGGNSSDTFVLTLAFGG